MEISNENIFRNIERNRRILLLLLVLSVALSLIFTSDISFWGIVALIAFVVFSILYFVRQAVSKLSFFSFELIGDILTFKNYTTGDFSFRRIKIAIPQDAFLGYTYKESFKGLRNEIILKESINGQTATYPPISISLLSAQQKQALFNYLSKQAIGGE